jgi:glycine betaine/proline transport system substrate-binding protein
MLKLRKLGMLLGVVLLTVSSSCKDGDKKEEKAKIKRSEHLYPNWSEGVAFTYLAKVALESDGDVTLTTWLQD